MAYRTISLKSDAFMKEGKASGAVTPGFMLERTTTADTLKAHAQAGQNSRLYAIENELYGKEIGQAYANAERLFYKAFQPGDEIYARIANGQNIAIGDRLTSNGDGYLKKATTDSSGVVVEHEVCAVALEACDMSGSSGADPSGLCVVEIQ